MADNAVETKPEENQKLSETPPKPQDEKEPPVGKTSLEKTISSSSMGENAEPTKVQDNKETVDPDQNAATDEKAGEKNEAVKNEAETPEVKINDPSEQGQSPAAGPDPGTAQEPPPTHPAPHPAHDPQQPPPPTTVVVNNISTGSLGSDPVPMTCPNCQQVVTTQLDYKSGCLTWLICGLLCLFGVILGCCLIPFCVNACKDVVHICPNCKVVIGRHKRI